MQKLNIVHVGFNYWGPNVAKNIAASPKTNLAAVVDINPTAIERARGLYRDNIKYSQDYREFLDNPTIDAFSIATQTEPSYGIAMDALKAGKHLFIEKPIAVNTEKAQAICYLANDKSLVVHCDHIMVHHPIVRHIKGLIDSGELGELIYFESSKANLGPIKADINAMLDLAVHDIAVLDYLSGGMEPTHIEAIGEKIYGRQETLTYLTMRYPGFLAHLKSSWISPLKERRTVIGGTKKMLVFDDVKVVDKLAIYDQGIVHRDTGSGYGEYEFKVRTGDMVAPYIPYEEPLRNSVEHFADCVAKGEASITGAEQAARVVKILDGAIERLNTWRS